MDIEGGSIRLHYVENSLCKRLQSCRKTDKFMMITVY